MAGKPDNFLHPSRCVVAETRTHADAVAHSRFASAVTLTPANRARLCDVTPAKSARAALSPVHKTQTGPRAAVTAETLVPRDAAVIDDYDTTPIEWTLA